MKIRNVTCYSYSLNAQEPMAYLRLIAPFRELGIDIVKGIDDNGRSIAENVHSGDLIVFQREFPVKFDDYRRIKKLASQEEKPTIFELDDLLFYLPETHPDRHLQYYASTLLPMLQTLIEVDLVIVTTEKMQDVLAEFNPNVVVVPNFFDDNLWRLNPPKMKDSSKDKLIIGYMGTNSHKPDLEYVAPVLLNLIQRYPDKLQFHFWGAQPPAELEVCPQVQWTSQFYSSYTGFVKYFQTQTADIFISPLCNTLFNRCKSQIKFFEYSALGSPGVYSRLEPYLSIVSHGKNGMLASSLDEWQDCLVQLIESDELRFHLALNAQTTIQDSWLLSKNAYRWYDVFQKAFCISSTASQRSTHVAKLLDSINSQQFEVFTPMKAQLVELEQTIQVQAAQLEAAEDEIKQLQEEIMRYVLSKSWRFTRPLRKLSRKTKEYLGLFNA